MPLAILIIEKKEKFYIEIYHPYKTVDINHALLQTPKQKLVEIF